MLAEAVAGLRHRWRAIFRRNTLEGDLDDELRFHLERETEKYLRQGIPEAEAARRARVAFGGVEQAKEQSRDARGIRLLDMARQDLRYAARSLRRNPAFSAAVILTLALGIGANAAMFGIIDRLLFRAPPFLVQPELVHRVYLVSDVRGAQRTEVTTQYTRYLDLKRWTTSFSLMAGYSVRDLPVGTGAEGRELPVATVSAAVFDFFDAKPLLGRFFTAEEDSVPVGANVAVLGYGFWQSHFGGRPDVLGQQLEIGTARYSIIGVAPRHFVGLTDRAPPVAFIPITAYAATSRLRRDTYFTRYNWGWMEILARRKPGVTVAAATADLSQAHAWSWNNERSVSPGVPPVATAHPRAILGPVQMQGGPSRSTVTRVAGWLGGVAVIVLLIACANVANLLLARAMKRRRELALRLALGVSWPRLAAQFLTESLLLTGAGALVGLGLAYWGGGVLGAFFLPAGVETRAIADARTLRFALAVALACAFIVGLAPIMRARRTDLVESLKAGVREGGHRRSRTRTALLLLQATLSVVLLVGAGLFVQSLRNVRALHLGYDVDSVLYLSLNSRGVQSSEDEAIQLRRRLLDRAQSLPGVQSAAFGLTVPFWDTWTEDLFVPGVDSVAALGSFTLQGGSAAFFSTVGTRIVRGRGIDAGDRRDAPRVVVVGETMARTLWPGQEALGQCLRVGADSMPCSTVVGIAEDIRQNSLADEPGRHYYLPIEQYHPESAVLFLRVAGDVEALKEAVRRQLQPLMPGDAYLTVTSMQEIVEPEMRAWHLGATMFLAFGGLALLLAAIGLYSVIAYDVAQRAHEVGVRIALGARMADVVRLVVGDGLRVTLIGGTAGVVLALLAGRWIGPILFNESPRDPLVFGLVAAVLLGAALVASGLPAWRATRVDPSKALRAE